MASTIAGAATVAALVVPEQVLYGLGFAVVTSLSVLVITRFALLFRPDCAGGARGGTEWGRIRWMLGAGAALTIATGGDGDFGLFAGVAAVMSAIPYLVLGLGVVHRPARGAVPAAAGLCSLRSTCLR